LEHIISAIEIERQRLREGEDLNERVIETAVERDDVSDAPVDDMGKMMMYQEASPKRPAEGADLLDTSVQAVADIVAEIVDVEGPIHQDEIVVRIRAVWGLQRTGARIQEHVSKAIRVARSTRGIEREGKFLNMPGRPVHLRNRSNVVSRNLRWPEMLAPAEIRAGVVDVVRENFGARSDEIIAAVLRRMGYATSSANLRDAVEAVIHKMRANGTLTLHGDLLVLVEAAAN
jgi:hypothetical protein